MAKMSHQQTNGTGWKIAGALGSLLLALTMIIATVTHHDLESVETKAGDNAERIGKIETDLGWIRMNASDQNEKLDRLLDRSE